MITNTAPRVGKYTVTLDNSPFTLEGKTFSLLQIMRNQAEGRFRNGMRFRHAPSRTEFTLTAAGLVPIRRARDKKAREGH